MGYPVAYRRGSEAFEPLNPGKYTRPNTKPEKIPVPDNDNVPPPPKSGVPRGVGVLSRGVGKFRRVARRHLVGLGIDLAEEVLNQWWTDRRHWNNNGWELRFGPCVPPASYPTDVGLLSYSMFTCLGGQALVESNRPAPWSVGIIGAARGFSRYYTYIGWWHPPSPFRLPVRKVWPEVIFAPRPEELPWLEPSPYVDPLSLPKLPWPLVALRPNTAAYVRSYAVPGPGEAAPSLEPSFGRPLVPKGEVVPLPGLKPWLPVRPPGPKVKERKIRMGGYGAINAVVGAATEAVDVVEALWDALPRSAQTREKGKKTTPQQKALDLYKGWPQLDLPAAVKNLLANELKDRAIGTIGQAVGKAAQKARPHGNLPIGYQAGAWDNGVFF